MVFNSYEELRRVVEDRRTDILTLEIDMGSPYSEEHEAAKRELAQGKMLAGVLGKDQQFLADNLAQLEQAVEDTRPVQNLVWVQYGRVPMNKWDDLLAQPSLGAVGQYEAVLEETFKGVYGQDPDPDDKPEGWVKPEPLSTDHELMSSTSDKRITPGASIHNVVRVFSSWQSSGGGVTIRPTRSGQD